MRTGRDYELNTKIRMTRTEIIQALRRHTTHSRLSALMLLPDDDLAKELRRHEGGHLEHCTPDEPCPQCKARQ